MSIGKYHLQCTLLINLLAAALAISALAPSSATAIVVQYPTAGNHIHQALDPAGNPPPDSSVFLAPDPIQNSNELFLLSSVSDAAKSELNDSNGDGLSDGDTHFNGWTFNYSFNTLSGTLFIDEYKAAYKGPHHGGGMINLRYEKGSGDPDILRWIQVITTTDPLNGAVSPYIDPFPNDGTDGAPFYWNLGEIGAHTNGSNAFGDFDLHFSDFSSRTHELPLPFDPIGWTAELYLVEYDGDKGVTFHDGIKWGWVMVPEPTPIMLIAIGAIAFFVSGKMSQHRSFNKVHASVFS